MITLPDGQLSTHEKSAPQMPAEDSYMLCLWSLSLGHGIVTGGSLYPQSCQTSNRLAAAETETSMVGFKGSPVPSSTGKEIVVATRAGDIHH